jgi:hypothetical protein
MEEDQIEGKMNPADYYKSLDYPSRILFKRELMKRLDWSPKTFHVRMSQGEYRPGELLIIEDIINTKSFLNPS